MEFLNHATLLAAGAVTLITEILKLNIVPLAFANRHPVVTNVALSIVAAYVVVNTTFDVHNWQAFVVQVGVIALVAAITYNQLLKAEVKPLEGTGGRR